VGGKSSEKRMPKLSISCPGGAQTADKKSEPQELDHLQKRDPMRLQFNWLECLH
jgi:hypothetical protein